MHQCILVPEDLTLVVKTKKCECGCGEDIPKYDRWRTTKERRFVFGHWRTGLWWYEGKPHTTLGKKRPDAANRMLNEGNPMWRGDDVKYESLHKWIRRRKPKSDLCEICRKKKPLDLANVSPKYDPDTYNRQLDNWRWLCRSCHMLSDKRMYTLIEHGFKRGVSRRK